MRSVWAVTYANLRGRKSQAASLLFFVFLATVFLSLGLLLMGLGDAYDSRSEADHAPHVVLIETNSLYSPAQDDFVRDYPGVTEMEKVPSVLVKADLMYAGSTVARFIAMIDESAAGQMNGLTVMTGTAPEADADVCVPYILKAGGGYRLGDTLTLTVSGVAWSYHISCFTEDLMFGPSTIEVLQFYVTHGEYVRRAAANPDMMGVTLRARMADPADGDRMSNLFTRHFFIDQQIDPDGWWWGMTYSIAKQMTTYLAAMTASLIILFAVILVVVSLLVIRFRIRNSIEETMTNTGVLKAIGYTDGQLILATLLQFCTVAAIGIVAGTGAGYAAIPVFWRVFEAETAMQWRPGFEPVRSLGTMAGVLAAVVLVTWLTARRLRTMTPMSALRQGLVPHNFERNYFPLESSAGPLSWLLALKYGMHSRRQSVVLFAIIVAVGVSGGVGASTYDNLAAHPDTFTRMMSGEPAEIQAAAQTGGEAADVRNFVAGLPGVRKTLLTDLRIGFADDMFILPDIADDFGQFEWQPLYEGRFPKHDNEITVSALLARGLGKGVGDQVRISMSGRGADFLIVGILQGSERKCRLTTGGVQRIMPEFQPRLVNVYLDDSSKSGEIIDAINQRFGQDTVSCTDLQMKASVELGVYRNVAQAVSFAILAVTLLVVLLSVWLVMETMILRRRREFGIQKTLGFTTRQLMNQLALHFIPIITIAVVPGALLGGLAFNPLFSALTRNLGIMSSSMPVPYVLTLVMCGVLIVIAYGFSMLVAWRLRRISVVALVTE